MIAILAEADSDANSVKTILLRLIHPLRPTITSRGLRGCGNLVVKGAKEISIFTQRNYQFFIICRDADCDNPRQVEEEIRRKVVAPSSRPESCIVVIPTQEIEAWLIADAVAVSRATQGRSIPTVAEPEAKPNPKEWLIANARDPHNRSWRYVPKLLNEQVAKELDLAVVERKCPSFGPLAAFAREFAKRGGLL